MGHQLIEPGRLIERPCPDCGGIERRAFGEAESHRGELSSYAFGWTSGHEDRVGHMTIGIGAGNEGGGSFNIEIRMHEGSPAMALVDRRFENVPEGGPHLLREEALAHDTLPYIWWVADEVMRQDRRAWWMEAWLRGTRSFATGPVVEETAPVRFVVRDDDGDWQLLCGTVEPTEAHVFHLHHALDRDQSLLEVLDLEPGERADREGPGAPWRRGPA